MDIHDRRDRLFESAFQHAAIGMGLVSLEGKWLRVNHSLCEIVGYSEEELLQTTFQEITHPDDLDTDLDLLHKLISGEVENYHLEKRYFHKQGHIIWILLSVSLVRDDNSEPQFFISQIQDITDRMQAYVALRESEQRLELALEGAELGTWDWNIKTGHVVFNDRWAEMLGYNLDELDPDISSWRKLIHPDEKEAVLEILSRHMRGEVEIYESRHRLRHKAGHWIWVLDKGKVIERDTESNPVRACGTHLDITERKEYERQLQEQTEKLRIANAQLDRLAHIDSLTGLYNRRAFTARLNEEGQRASRNGTPLSLIVIDIDDFKSYNDSYGHPEGDILLQQLANLMQNNLRTSDIAARTGGEEFTVILPETSRGEATNVAEKLCRTVAGYPWILRPITVSMGISTATIGREVTGAVQRLISTADNALYHAKRHGKNRICHVDFITTHEDEAGTGPK